jgi:glucose-6-phosphate isomerase|tara:strand:+ start:1041 stop:2213 length:1173 start_codon:yes stop_codon:yes gene_type:complete
MFTKNIKFENFSGKKNIKLEKTFKKSLNYAELLKNYPLLNSLTKQYKYSYQKKEIKSLKKYSNINLVGMGGSTLGAEAIYDFLKHKVKKKFFFFNNLQSRKINKNNKKNINLVISKSGNTLETISNLNLLLQKQNKNKNIFICEKKNNFLFLLAKKLKAEIFEHKNYIGGRYSVLSEVGMLPAELMGLNEKKFKRFNYLIKNKIFIKSLINNVLLIYNFIKKGKRNSIILNYDEKSENLFKWYQQLTAESLGKKGNGILPVISTMPKDNHSLLQLYLDGPKNNFYTFFNVKDKNSPNFYNSKLFDKYPIIKNKNLYKVLNSQKKATENVFRRSRIPFRSFEIVNRNEETLGELFCFFILETILLGKLLKVNPFDQPSVELIKDETKKILI